MSKKTIDSSSRLFLRWEQWALGAALMAGPALLGAKGCEIAVIGHAGAACGGLAGAACGSGLFCEFPLDAACGAADQTGTCRQLPEVCTQEYDPVCGCDDRTYGNACEAHAAGVSVAGLGSCDSTGGEQTCGGLAGLSCREGEYCNYPLAAECGAGDRTGTCEIIPQACTKEYAPVCGCDGNTYANDCNAGAAGVAVAHSGECDSEPPDGGGQSCGTRGAGECGADEFCEYPPSARCGETDLAGTCQPRPEACREIYQPVCGCDGNTYGNECEAHAAGISVAQPGECGGANGQEDCGGLTGASCSDGDFCNYPLDALCGAADATGTCEPIPEVCSEEYDPVCGCDDRTYANACAAHAAGVSVSQVGECASAPPSDTCGGIAALTCADGEYCHFPASTQCGSGDQTGSCEPIPEVCTEEYAPVCGCDGETYGNQCLAAVAGVSVADSGECAATSQTCGGLLGESCDAGQFCDYPIGAQCGAADATGNCRSVPEVCTEEYAPVCGCDGVTYDNDCLAATRGVSVSGKGECGTAPTGTPCGGLLGATCPADQYCDYAVEARCGAADATGTCTLRPEVCTAQFMPVCGCDGKTYGNACEAASAGVAVTSEEACDEQTCGGLLGVGCAEGQFCNYPEQAQCGAADQTGTCESIPLTCDDSNEPVCGCDDRTYANRCEAHLVGVSVASPGACE